MGLRVDDRGHPNGLTDPLDGLEIEIHGTGSARLLGQCAGRGPIEPDPIQEVGHGPSRGAIGSAGPISGRVQETAHGSTVPSLFAHQRVGSALSLRAVLCFDPCLLPPRKHLFRNKGLPLKHLFFLFFFFPPPY